MEDIQPSIQQDYESLLVEFHSSDDGDLSKFRDRLLPSLGLDNSLQSLAPGPWDAHVSLCLETFSEAHNAIFFMESLGVTPCAWENISLRDSSSIVPGALDYLKKIRESGEVPLQKVFAAAIEYHLETADSHDTADMIIQAGHLRLIVTVFHQITSGSTMTGYRIRHFLARNRPLLHLPDDWRNKLASFRNKEELVSDLTNVSDPEQAVGVLLKHKFPLHESSKWEGPQKLSVDLEVAFTAEYLDPWKNVDRLISFVNSQSETYFANKATFMAPYTSIVQSSGTGKTRLLREYANKIPCVYMCIADRSEMCFPKPSELFRTAMLATAQESTRHVSEDKMKHVLLKLLAVAFMKGHAVEWDAKKLIACQSVGVDGDNQIEDSFAQSKQLLAEDALKQIVQSAPQVTSSPTMVLILDEARGLISEQEGYISPFRIFCKAWASLAQDLYLASNGRIKIFALLTDTTSRVANFSPSTGLDASFRTVVPKQFESGPCKLLKPYFMVVNMDVFVKSRYPSTLAEAFDMETIARKGRPIWSATIQSSENDGIENALYLAKRKICGGIAYHGLSGSKELFTIAIASLGMRIVLDVHSYGTLAEKLSSSSMRFITAITESRDAVLTEYPSDPFLSHASSLLTSSEPMFRPAEVLRYLLGSLQHKLVSHGNIGELVQQYIDTLARDSVVFARSGSVLPSNQYPLFSVAEFLKSLHSQSVNTLSGTREDKAAVLQGTMSFSHFIQLEYTPTERDLLDLFIRGAAACCKAGQAGVDLIIPILMKPATGQRRNRKYQGHRARRGVTADCDDLMTCQFSRLVDGVLSEGAVTRKQPEIFLQIQTAANSSDEPSVGTEISEANISFLLCQVKNRIEPDAADDDKLDPVYCGLVDSLQSIEQPYLAIRHELRCSAENNGTAQQMEASVGRVGLVIFRMKGDTSECLKFRQVLNDAKVEELLEQLLTVSAQCLKMAEDLTDRLVLAVGALRCQIKLSEFFLKPAAKAKSGAKRKRLD